MLHTVIQFSIAFAVKQYDGILMPVVGKEHHQRSNKTLKDCLIIYQLCSTK